MIIVTIYWAIKLKGENTMSMIRRTLLMSLGAASLLVGTAMAQTNEIKVGLIAPFSGPWARQGELMLKGAELAIDHINASGGIKSMGGAKLKLLTFDTSDSAEKAKNAAIKRWNKNNDLDATSMPQAMLGDARVESRELRVESGGWRA
jgi:branched-chain amino acid transport system substrate-binding protein